MTISFSGLASGLDTSSWVTSLTALKQAKVTVLQQEREELVVSKDTLSSIRSFFSSFRSVIERVTDTRFNIPALDLFAQNIATSANLDVFTASATTEAEEGSYDITVKKLATKTKATSDYRYKTTIVETTTATGDSYLKHIGITAGQVLVNTPAGIERTLEIEENETISSLIEKFKEIGVNANYNEKSGVFTIDISTSDINDIGGTNIVDALHLSGVNEGYDSFQLQIETITREWEVATEDTKLSELNEGIVITGTQNVTVQNSSGENYTIEVDENTTIGEFLTALQDSGLSATLYETGVLEINGGQITGGTFDAISAFGLNSNPFTAQVAGNPLTETIVEYELVTYDTRLVDDLGVKEGYLEVVDSEGNAQYEKIYSGQTIGDLMSDLANMGIYSTLDEDNGILTITGGDFHTLTDADVNALIANGTIRETDTRYMHGTDLLTALYGAESISLDQTEISQTYAMSRALTKSSTIVVDATGATTLSELGVTTTETITLHKEDGSVATFNVNGNTTLAGLLQSVNNNGVTATLDEGVIYLEGGWMENATVEDALGLEHSTASSYVLGSVKTVSYTYNADSDTTLGELGFGTTTVTVNGVDGVAVGTITTNADMTIGDLLTALSGYGISGTIKNGVITLDSDIGNWATGGVITSMGIGTTTSTYTTTAGTTGTSSAVINYNTVTTSTAFPTLTRTILTTSTIVTTTPIIGTKTLTIADTVTAVEPVIGSQTFVVTHTHTCTEVVGGTRTLTQTHTIVDTVPVIGSQTVIVTHTHVVTEPVIVENAQVLSVTTPVSYTQYNFASQTINLSGSQNVVSSSTVVVQEAVAQTIITTTTSTYTSPITSTQTTSTSVTSTNYKTFRMCDLTAYSEPESHFGAALLRCDSSGNIIETINLPNFYATDTVADLVSAIEAAGGGNVSCSYSGGYIYLSSSGSNQYRLGPSANFPFSLDSTQTQIYIGTSGQGTQITTIDYTTTTTTTTHTQVVEGSQPVTVINKTTTPVTYSLSTVVTVLTGSTPMSVNAVGYITVDSVTTTTRTVTTYTTHTVEKTSTKPVTHTIITTDIIPTYTYKTVTHQSTTTHVVEKTSTKTVTHTVMMTFTVENTTTMPITHTIIGTCVVDTTTYTITTTTSTATMTGDTKFSQLGSSATGYATVNSDGISYIVTVEAGDTVDDMLTALAGLGIAGSIEGGKVILRGDNEAYITGISNNLATALKLNTSYYTTTNHTITANTASNQQTHVVTSLMNDNTSLTDLGITDGNILITEEGVHYTVNINTTTLKNMGGFRNLLSNYGFTSYIDNNGRLCITGDSDSYLSTITGGSNIITQLDIDDWTFGNMTQVSDYLTDTAIDSESRINGDTLVTELQDSDGNSLGITTGEYVVYSNGVRTVETINADTTIDDFIATLSTYGMVANLATDGSIAIGGQHNSYLATAASGGDNTNMISTLFAEWNFVNVYTSNNIEIPQDVTIAISETTKLSDINEDTYSEGIITIVKDGVETNLTLTSDDTVGTLLDELSLFGFESVVNNAGQIILKSDGSAYIKNYTGVGVGSNALDILGIGGANWIQTDSYIGDCVQTSELVTTYTNATEDTLLENLDIAWTDAGAKATGDLMVTVDGSTSAIHIEAGESIGSLIEKFRALGLEASISNGKLIIQSGYTDFLIETAGTTSNIIDDFGLVYNADMGGYVASIDVCEQTTTRVEDRAFSASNYASDDTLMSLLNISSGTLSLYRDGQKATILIDSNETFGQLRSRIATAFADVDIEFENGFLKFYSNSGASVEVGSTTDTSNFNAICGLVNDKSGTVYSARELYNVNAASKITTAGLFRRDDVTEGTFIVGNATFTIDSNTTMGNLISQINSSEEANAVAYWDSVDGKLILTSRSTGSSFINIEAGTSNFTDVMGYTTTTRQADGVTVDVTKLDIAAQDVGENAVFTINGTTYSSTSNTIESDISRITGVTINLKGISEEGETVTLKVERDKETLANAISDVVDAYNALIENVDKEVAKGAALSDQFTLKLIRNQIRNLMTSSLGSATVFKNMDAIGIMSDKATAGSIDVSTVNVLSFDKDKFFKAFEADQEAVKALVVGTDTSQGILSKIETVVEQALTSASGYFSSADKSYDSQISRMDAKIKKEQDAVDKYKIRLENKFSAMDLLISKIQTQYSSFLGS